MTYKILLVEDDEALRESISDYLTVKGIGTLEITEAENGSEALLWFSSRTFDLVLLDIMLPGVDGFSLCREFRKHSDVPVMFLTARVLEEDKLRGYDLGCDDYLVKPFSLAELLARSKALIRRYKGGSMSGYLTVGEIALEPRKAQVTVGGVPVELPRREYQLLKYLLEHKNLVVSRNRLLDAIWGLDFTGSDRVVDNHIRKLRKSLGTEACRIRTVLGMGYRLEG